MRFKNVRMMLKETMDLSEALRIVRSLADGIDPHTGEVFPDDSPYQNPQVVRALFLAVRALERLEARKRREKHLPERAGKPWTDEEDKALCEGFNAGLTVPQLAQRHKRTEGAIRARLEKLGIVIPHFQPPRTT